MSSEDRILANKRNAARSTGPITDAGKLRASGNALKHGLNVSIRREPSVSSQIEALAMAITGDNPTPQQLNAAHDIAEATFELRRVQQFKLSIIENKKTKLRAVATDDDADEAGELSMNDYMLACAEAFPALTKADRIERRILSRHRRAISAYIIAACE